MKSALLLLLLSTAAYTQTIQERVAAFEKPNAYAAKYDKFTDRTKVETLLTVKKSRGTMRPRAAVEVGNGDPVFILFFHLPARYYARKTLRLLVDGEPFAASGDVLHDIAGFALNPSVVSALNGAKTVEMRLDDEEGVLDAPSLVKIKNLAFLTTISQPR